MKKGLLILLGVLLILSSCITTPKEKKQNTALYESILDLTNESYSQWRSNRDTDEFQILFYGKNGSYREVSRQEHGPGEFSGSPQVIFYRNTTDKKNLASISIIGMNKGGPQNPWSFTVENGSGTILYQSPQYFSNEFPPMNYAVREFPAAVENIPEDFFIFLETNSSKDNKLFVMCLPSEDNLVYSFRYNNDTGYELTKGENYSIFPKMQ